MTIVKRITLLLPALYLASQVAALAQIGIGGDGPALSAASNNQFAASAQATKALSKQKPVFIENKGQWDERTRFLMRTPGMDLWITNNGVVYDLNRVERVDKKADRN